MKEPHSSSNSKLYDTVKFNPPHKLWLFATMRAIFDSKYAEHKYMIESNFRGHYCISRFPGKFNFIL